MWEWMRHRFGANDRDKEEGLPVNAYGPEWNWTFCHTVRSDQEPHQVQLELLEVLDETRSGSSEESLYRCRTCGQLYFYTYQEVNDWTSHGDRTLVQHRWFPISADEMRRMRETRRFDLSPREHLSFGT